MRVLLVLLTALLSTSCFANLVVKDATIRLLPPGVPTTSAYFTIENDSEEDVYLTGGSTEIASTVEIHKHIHSDGMMKMQKQQRVKIPAGGALRFSPGGYHLMLFNLNTTLQEGRSIPITLIVNESTELTVPAKVVKPGNE